MELHLARRRPPREYSFSRMRLLTITARRLALVVGCFWVFFWGVVFGPISGNRRNWPRRARRVEHPAAFASETSLAGSHVTSLVTSDGRIWAGRFGGLTEIAPDRSSIRSYTTAEGLSGTGIWSLAEDRNGNLWIGSEDAGVMRLTRDGFRKFDARDGLSSTRIGSLFEDRAGELCAFTRGTRSDEIVADVSFLECFDGRRFRSARPRLLPGGSFGWGRSQIVVQDRRGEWWLPSVAGVYRFPAVPFQRLDTAAPLQIYTQRDGLPSGLVSRLFLDRSENLWVGMVNSDSRLAVWSRATDSFRSFSEKDGVPREEPAAFAEDRSGAVWVGFDSGLARIRRGAVRFFSRRRRVAEGSDRGAPRRRTRRALARDRQRGRRTNRAARAGSARVRHVRPCAGSVERSCLFPHGGSLGADLRGNPPWTRPARSARERHRPFHRRRRPRVRPHRDVDPRPAGEPLVRLDRGPLAARTGRQALLERPRPS